MKVDLLLKNAEIFDGEGLYHGCLGISKEKIVSLGQNNVTGFEDLMLRVLGFSRGELKRMLIFVNPN